MGTATEAQNPVRSAVPVGLAVVLAYLVMATGIATIGLGLPDAMVRAPVDIKSPAPAWSSVVLPCVEGWSLHEGGGCGPAASPQEWPGGAPLPVQHADPVGGFVAEVDATRVDTLTTVLSASPVWASLLAGGLALLLLIPVIRSTADGHPFAAGNSRRWAAATAVTAIGWALATIGPYLAARAIIPIMEATPQYTPAAETFTLPAGWLGADLRVAWWPLLVIALLGCLAAATRRGARLAADTEGLV